MSLTEKKALDIMRKAGGTAVEEASLTAVPHGFAALLAQRRQLICLTEGPCAFADRLECLRDEYRYGVRVRVAACDNKNSQILRLFLKWTAPRACGPQVSSLGLEDDFGLLFPSFALTLANGRFKPVLLSAFATPEEMAAATGEAAWQAMGAGLKGGYGAELAYAGNEQEIMNALLCGYTGIVIDCADKLNLSALRFSDEQAGEGFAALPAELQTALLDWYADKSFLLAGEKLTYRRAELCRLTLCYGEALAYLIYVYNAYFKHAPWPVDFSLRAGALTTKAHYLLAWELKRAGARVAAVEASPLHPDFAGNIAVSKNLEHKLRIVLTDEHRTALAALRLTEGIAVDLRPPAGLNLLHVRAALPDAVNVSGETAALSQQKDKLREMLAGHGEEYRRRAAGRLAEDKELLERLSCIRTS